MDDFGLQIGLVLILIITNALLAGSEVALVSLREGQIRKLEEGGRRPCARGADSSRDASCDERPQAAAAQPGADGDRHRRKHGGVDGLITIEDLLEELVGEIYDEFDRDISGVERADDGSFVVPEGFPVHDLEDIGVDLPRGEYTTVAGLILDRLGRVPEPHETIEIDDYRVEVLEVSQNAITRVRIRKRIA